MELSNHLYCMLVENIQQLNVFCSLVFLFSRLSWFPNTDLVSDFNFFFQELKEPNLLLELVFLPVNHTYHT